jgi:hypothetical protein
LHRFLVSGRFYHGSYARKEGRELSLPQHFFDRNPRLAIERFGLHLTVLLQENLDLALSLL